MKIRILTGAILAVMGIGLSYAASLKVERIDPPHWWVGMKNTTLQLQVYGADIREAVPEINYPGVSIDSVARLDGSPNYQYIYLNISNAAKPGSMRITWRSGKKHISRNYELRARKAKGGAQGFTAADVLYMIMPDRFADGNTENNLVKEMRFPIGADRSNLNVRHGGDLKGIMNHLDYIDSLGVTAVWLNPVLENDMPGGSYHGYATTDYYNVDRRFGNNADYRQLIDSLHGRGIKVVMDMIFNHCGSEHPWMLEMPSKDWINFGGKYTQTNHKLMSLSDPYASDYDRKLTTDGWFVDVMPDLNQRNPHLMRYLSQNSIWWIEEAGIDAIRMDTYPYADKDAMAGWVTDVEREYPDFTIVGECWFANPGTEQAWQRGSRIPAGGKDSNLPVVMDFALMLKSRGLAPYQEETDEWGTGLVNIYNHFAQDNVYAEPMKVLRFLDNHDTDRLLPEQPETLDAWKQAQTILLTMPGIPQIYYGTELLMSGDRKPGDGNVRRDMPGGFPGDSVNVFSTHGRSELQNEAYDFLSKLMQWRKGAEAIHTGKMKHFAPKQGVYVYERYIPGTNKRVLVMLNGTSANVDLNMAPFAEILPTAMKWHNVLIYKDLILSPAETLNLKPREILVLEPAL